MLLVLGITIHLDQTINYFKDQIDFEIVMGGLRPGGGDAWNSDMKSFLKGHWQHVEKASGQEFNHGLFDLETFNYDTEPACRAIAIIKYLGANKALVFYRSIQHSFYVLNNDPNELEFYKPICDSLNIDFYKFSEIFNTSKGRALVNEDFVKTKTFGVSGFPTLLIQNGESTIPIARGYATFDDMKNRIEPLLST